MIWLRSRARQCRRRRAISASCPDRPLSPHLAMPMECRSFPEGDLRQAYVRVSYLMSPSKGQFLSSCDSENGAPGARITFGLDVTGEPAQALAIGVVLHRNRELAVGDHAT